MSNSPRLPDFFIPGAMKAGTTFLQQLLVAHPNIYIPAGEPQFFSLDDFEENRSWFMELGDTWLSPSYQNDYDQYLAGYRERFKAASKNSVTGDRSTTYLPSRKAPRRIANECPDAKFIVLLRDPVERCYSHYWHLVRKGMALYDFETTIERGHRNVVTRSFYEESIRRYFRYFDRDQFRFVLFEEFIAEPESVLRQIHQFLGVSEVSPDDKVYREKNRGYRPVFTKAWLFLNRLFKRHAQLPSAYATIRKFGGVQNIPSLWELQFDKGLKGIGGLLVRNRLVRKLWSLLSDHDFPQMESHTREFLEELFVKENRSLSNLISRDLSKYWPYFPSR